ncbi:Inner membrane protein ybaN [Croceibacterium mercuriale]|uniref:Inner membrane protein ybaN n=2 Tax=Croceibacterium mercuriale TaxID=1572751 RepID=A0A0B2C3V3_9SPHN|nr:Inner membrane protein ybaN [Croceibacterium mercuriale]
MLRSLWMAAGLVMVVLGIIGLILPMMPGVVFFIGAAFCFARGNPAWEQRLLADRRIGPHLIAWRSRGAISAQGKRAALIMMAIAAALTWWRLGWPWAAVSSAVLVVVALWIATRPE